MTRERQVQIRPEAVEAFKRAIELKKAASAEDQKPYRGAQGPLKSALTDAKLTVKRELGLGPWEQSPIDVNGRQTAPRSFDSPQGWRKAQELRAALLQGAGLEPEGE
jgi:hypothetical protein